MSYDPMAERLLLALALHGHSHVAAQARTALALCPPTTPERRALLDRAPQTYEEEREAREVVRCWPHGHDVLDLLDVVREAAARRVLLARAVALATLAREGDGPEVLAACR